MESHTFLIQLVLILFSARVVGEVAARLKIPSVIGELFAGILIGPSLLGIVEATPSIQLLAHIGIILLLFEVGLETDMGKLISAGLKAFIVAIAGVVLPFAFGFGLSHYVFHFSTLSSLFIGCTLTATSIGITLRVLSDLKKQSSPEAQVILGAAVVDDIIGIVLLSLLFEFSSSGEVNFWNTGKVMLFIIIFFLVAPFSARIMSAAIQRWEAKSDIPGLIPTLIVSLILLFAWLAHQLGAPELLGGFAAGLALSKQFLIPFAKFLNHPEDFTHRVHKSMQPIIHLFTPIFFVTIGLSLNLKEIDWGSSFIWILTGSLLLVATITKLASGIFLFKESSFSKLVIGTSMVPRGEVGLIFAEVGLKSGIFDNEVYASLILVIAITTLLAPFALRWLYENKSPTNSYES